MKKAKKSPEIIPTHEQDPTGLPVLDANEDLKAGSDPEKEYVVFKMNQHVRFPSGVVRIVRSGEIIEAWPELLSEARKPENAKLMCVVEDA